MITKLSKKVSFYFSQNKMIESNDREVFEYSFEVLFSTFVNFGAIAVIAFLTNSVSVTALYLLGFIPMRLIAGGYHAKTHLRCFVLLLVNYSLFLSIVRLVPMEIANFTALIVLAGSIILILILAPVADQNKPLSENEYRRNKAISQISVSIYAVLLVLIISFGNDSRIALPIVLGLFSVALSLLSSVIRDRIVSSST